MQSELIPIARFSNLPAAGLAKSILEAEGIYSFIPNETIIGLRRPFMGMINGIELRVPANCAQQAIEILQKQNQAAFKEPAVSAEKSEACPQCGSTNVYRYNPLQNARIISLLTFLLYLFSGKKLSCSDCGAKFKPPAKR